jgi:hypothetical protein
VDLKDAADVELQAGDILLLEVGEGFAAANDNNPAFGLLSQVPKSSPLKTRLMWPALVLTAVMIITQVGACRGNQLDWDGRAQGGEGGRWGKAPKVSRVTLFSEMGHAAGRPPWPLPTAQLGVGCCTGCVWDRSLMKAGCSTTHAAPHSSPPSL